MRAYILVAIFDGRRRSDVMPFTVCSESMGPINRSLVDTGAGQVDRLVTLAFHFFVIRPRQQFINKRWTRFAHLTTRARLPTITYVDRIDELLHESLA